MEVAIFCRQNNCLPTRTNLVYSNPYNLNLILTLVISIRYMFFKGNRNKVVGKFYNHYRTKVP